MAGDGLVTIPRAVRNKLGWKPGDQITLTLLGDRAILMSRQREPTLGSSKQPETS
jgi:AbrB family looped-hinge helix DNA binding protein